MPKNIFCFINKCSFKSSPRSDVTITPYSYDEVFSVLHAVPTHKRLFLAKQRRDDSETCRGVAGINTSID